MNATEKRKAMIAPPTASASQARQGNSVSGSSAHARDRMIGRGSGGLSAQQARDQAMGLPVKAMRSDDDSGVSAGVTRAIDEAIDRALAQPGHAPEGKRRDTSFRQDTKEG